MKARAVKKAAKAAEKLHEEIYGTAKGDSDPDAILDSLDGDSSPPDGDVTAAQADTPPAEPAGDVPAASADEPTPPAEGTAEPVTAQPAEPADPTDTVTPPADPAATELLEKAEHKYSVLQGMHRKLLDENTELRARIDALESASAPAPQPSPVTGDDPLITSEDVDDYGSDLISMVKRAAHEELSPELAKLRAENEQLKNQIAGVTTVVDTTAKESIYSTLAKEVPDWKQINTSEDYLFWLAQRDAFSGQRRHDLLTQAFKDNDAARVITFFKAYLNEDTAVTPPEPAATPAPVQEPKVDLMSMAAPGRAQSGGQPSNQTDARVYSRAEISAHYKAVQTGKFRGTEAEKQKIEREFIKAANEGRVT